MCTQQIVARERRERISHHRWSGLNEITRRPGQLRRSTSLGCRMDSVMILGHLRFGLFAGVVVLIAANIYSYFRMRAVSTIGDGFVYFGWPFNIYASGGYSGHSVYIWTGLLANVAFAVILGVFIALLAGRLRPGPNA